MPQCSEYVKDYQRCSRPAVEDHHLCWQHISVVSKWFNQQLRTKRVSLRSAVRKGYDRATWQNEQWEQGI